MPANTALAPGARQAIKGEICRVLVVDDEPGILHDYRQAFAQDEIHAATRELCDLAADLFSEAARADKVTPIGGQPGALEPAFDLVVCQQGDAAIAAMRDAHAAGRPFSVAFVDVRMPPGIDGVTTAAEMQAIDPSLNVVIVTGYSDIPRREIANRLSRGNFFYFQKPFLAEEFMQLAWALHLKRSIEADYRRLNAHLQDEVDRRSAELKVALHRALEATRAKSAFLSNMSHELRTPLNAIIGFSDIIQNQRFGKVGEPRYAAYAADIHTSAQHLLDLINDVLDYSKIEAGGMELFEALADIDAMLDFAVNLLRIKANEKSIDIRHDPIGPQAKLFCDERRVRQVLLNLLANAIKFTPTGGSIHLTAELVAARPGAGDGTGEMTGDAIGDTTSDALGDLLIRVTDSGIGMTREQATRALEPFVQVTDSFTCAQEGTGLGLPISLSLMKLHDGDLTIASTPAQGTTVTIRFPASRLV